MTTGLSIDVAQIKAFFTHLYPQGDWPGVININFLVRGEGDDKSKVLNNVYLNSLETLEKCDFDGWAEHQSHHANVFFTCALLKFEGRRTKANLTAISHVWADVDDVTEDSLELLLSTLPLAPSLVTFTGNGFHFYWRLNDWYYDVEPKGLAEKAVLRAHNWLPADKTHNLNRILRVPGTFNVKPKYINSGNIPMCRIVYKENNFYTLQQIVSVLCSYREIKLPDSYKEQHILKGECFQNNANTGKPDRSDRDFAIAKELFQAGHSFEEVEYIFSNPLYGCSNKVLERGQNGTSFDYLKTTLQKAQLDAGSIKRGGSIFDDGSRIVKKKILQNGFVTEDYISNFCVVPQRRLLIRDLAGNSEVLEIQFRMGKDQVKHLTVTSGDLIGWKNFKERIGTPLLSFTGTDTDFAQYVDFLSQKDIPIGIATKTVGWTENTFVLPQGSAIGPEMEYIDSGLMNQIHVVDEPLPLTREFWYELFKTAQLLHKPSASLLTLGWMLASVFSPQIRDKYKDQFPTLSLHGSHGTGKTTLARTYMRSLFGVMHDYSGKTTVPVLLRALSYVNALPVLVDEYETNAYFDMNLTLRALWQRGYAQRMQRGQSEEANNLRLQAPVVLTNQSGIDDEATQDRCVNLRLTKFNRETGKSALNWFDALPQGGFLRSWITTDPTNWIASIDNCRNMIEASDRQQHSWACAVAPLLNIAQQFGFVDLGLDIQTLRSYWGGSNHMLVTPFEVIDELLAHLIRTLKFVPRNPGYLVNGNIIRIHRAHFIVLALELAPKMSLTYPVNRQWILNTLRDAHQAGLLKTNGKPCNLYGTTTICFEAELDKLPLTKEAFMGYLDLPERTRADIIEKAAQEAEPEEAPKTDE